MTISNNQIQGLVIYEDESIERLLEVMTQVVTPRLGSGYAIVVNREAQASGVVTDADLRKFSARNARLPKNIAEVAHTDFISVEEGLSENEVVESLLDQMKSRGWKTVLPVRFVPVLKSGIPIAVIDAQDLHFEISSHRDRLVVIGLGYVGLTLALAASSAGMSVVGIDSDYQKIESLKRKKSYISEPGIENLLNELVESDFYPRHTLFEMARAPGQSWNFILCVPTPLTRDFNLDTTYIKQAINDLLPYFQIGDSVILRSTVPIGTTREIAVMIEKELGWSVGTDFYAISAPERTVEGNALYELRELPQILGGVTANCAQHGYDLFQKISKRLVPVSSSEVSETIKITSNAFRDYTFGFSNYLTKVAQSYDLDVNEIIDNANFGYLRNSIPKPSPGVGGPCLSKDPYLLCNSGFTNLDSPVYAARKVNESMTQYVYNHLAEKIPSLLTLEILIIGLAFKGAPETNDMRNSPSIELAELFFKEGKRLFGWDAVVESSTIPSIFLRPKITSRPQVFLILNNHENNVQKLNTLLVGNNEKIWIFDPWRLIGNPKEILRFAPRGITYITLSNSMEYFPHE
jgi:UDP-N-acetyl-D-mannosaminuronic acid dehydrogenase